MEFSEYENIEIFNKTQRFGINKCENQILREYDALPESNIRMYKMALTVPRIECKMNNCIFGKNQESDLFPIVLFQKLLLNGQKRYHNFCCSIGISCL